jgi:leader peptidase (prepilin peptidase)/N-methyltransferase
MSGLGASSRAGAAAAGTTVGDAPARASLALVRYPALVGWCVAAVVALAFAVLPLDRALVTAVTAAVLVVLSAIDLEHGIIPNRIVLPATGVVLLMQLALFGDRTGEWLLAALATALVLVLPQLIGRAWMGMGDVKLGLLLGVSLGWAAAGAILLAFVCVFPVALLIVIRDGLSARRATLPFGPFLSLGALIVLFGPQLAGLSS